VSDIAAALDGLRQRFLVRSAEDWRLLRAWTARGAPPDDEMRRLVHRLAGAAGTFGFHELSARAKETDDRLCDGLPADPANAAALIAELRRVLDALRT
jgi:HPt (histidine-containing phosphotransfer) domain-containing protein